MRLYDVKFSAMDANNDDILQDRNSQKAMGILLSPYVTVMRKIKQAD